MVVQKHKHMLFFAHYRVEQMNKRPLTIELNLLKESPLLHNAAEHSTEYIFFFLIHIALVSY